MTAPAAADLANAEALAPAAGDPSGMSGMIQPHGALLALDPLTRRVTHASANVRDILGLASDFEPLGSSLEMCVGADAASRIGHRLAQCAAASHLPVHACIGPQDTRIDVLAHRQAGRILLEFTPARSQDAGEITPEYLQRVINMLQGDIQDETLWALAADLVRDLTGLHRVMICRFDEDWNGEVVGESRRRDLESFLGVDYPAGAIPVQVRRLCEENLEHYIPDTRSTPVALRLDAGCAAAPPLDMRRAGLGDVAREHLELLQRMGVRAAFELPLMVEGRLWGLIASHHYEPAVLPLARRRMAGIVAHALATVIGRSTARSLVAATARANLLNTRMLAAASADGMRDLGELFGRFEAEIRAAMQAGAVLVWSGESAWWWGEAAPGEYRAALIALMRQRLADAHRWETSGLGAHLPGETVFGGVLAVRFAESGGAGIAILRLPLAREASRAGDPREVAAGSSVADGPSARRASAAWCDIMPGRSAPWSEAARRFLTELASVHVRYALRQAEQALGDRTRALEAARRQLEDFDHIIAHDLRAPLRGLAGFATLLRSGDAGDSPVEREHYLQCIIDNAEFMNRLLDDAVAFAHISRADVKFGPVSCNALVAECLGRLRRNWPAARFEVANLPDCTGDTALLGKLWTNLLDNAAKYSAGRKDSLVQVDFHQGYYRVRDNGIGFDQQYADKVFGIFTRLHGRQDFAGSGIGMAVARRVVERHGGVIEAHGRVGEGATFRFRV